MEEPCFGIRFSKLKADFRSFGDGWNCRMEVLGYPTRRRIRYSRRPAYHQINAIPGCIWSSVKGHDSVGLEPAATLWQRIKRSEANDSWDSPFLCLGDRFSQYATVRRTKGRLTLFSLLYTSCTILPKLSSRIRGIAR